MRESATYQAILREGKEEGLREGALDELRRVLLLLGLKQASAVGFESHGSGRGARRTASAGSPSSPAFATFPLLHRPSLFLSA